MFQPTPVMPYLEPSIHVDGKNLKVDEKLTYLRSIMNCYCHWRFLCFKGPYLVSEGLEEENGDTMFTKLAF